MTSKTKKPEIEIAICAPAEKVPTILKRGMPPNRVFYVPGETDKGDPVGDLNPWYCEATAMYWLWKTSKAKIVGLEHYRRYFVDAQNRFLNESQIKEILGKDDVIVAEHTFGPDGLEFPAVVYSIVVGWEKRKYQAYKFIYGFILWLAKNEKTYDMAKFFLNDLYDEQTFIKCNMFIARKKVLNEWCKFIFPAIDKWREDEGIILDKSNLRLIGYVFEHIFGSWLKWRKYKINVQRHIVLDKELYGIDVAQMGWKEKQKFEEQNSRKRRYA